MTRTLTVMALVWGVWGSALMGTEAKKGDPVGGIDLFDAIKAGQIETKLIAMSDKEAHLIMTNRTKQPLSIKLPEGLAGVPVLAQQPGLLAPANPRAQPPQPLGMTGRNPAANPGLMFNIAPEKSRNVKLACVCLKHGAPEPNSSYRYDVVPAEQFSTDPKVQELLKLFGHRDIDRQVMQAAAWHVANDMSWKELSKKELKRLGQRPELYFTAATIEAAKKLVAEAEQRPTVSANKT